jgi:hypothetical protein
MKPTNKSQPVNFLECDDILKFQPLSLVQIIPFLYKNNIKNARIKELDEIKIMIQYEISFEFHDFICKNMGIIYGTVYKNMSTISFFIKKSDKYLDYIKIKKIHKILQINILSLDKDVFGIICQNLNFKEQLNLRVVCKGIKNKITYYNYNDSNMLNKLGRMLLYIYGSLYKEYKYMVVNEDIYDKNKLSAALLYRKYYYTSKDNMYNNIIYWFSYSESPDIIEFKSYDKFVILGKEFTISELIDNIQRLMILDNLINLLKFDSELRFVNKSFTQKDLKLLNQHKLASHWYKTNDCYFKFNKDLKKFFNDTKWFIVVRDILYGNVKCNYTLSELEVNINPILEFGVKVEEHYEAIRSNLCKCKREFHNNGRNYY